MENLYSHKNLSISVLDNESIVIPLLALYPFYYKKISKRLKANKEVVNIVFSKDCSLIKYAPYKIRDDFDITYMALSGNGFCYNYFSERLKKDPEIIKKCLREMPIEFPTMSKEIRDNEEYFKIVIKTAPLFYLYGSERLRENEEIFLISCSLSHGYNLKHAGFNIRNNTQVLMKALDQHMYVEYLKYATIEALMDTDLCIKVIGLSVECFLKVAPERLIKEINKEDIFEYFKAKKIKESLQKNLIIKKDTSKQKKI